MHGRHRSERSRTVPRLERLRWRRRRLAAEGGVEPLAAGLAGDRRQGRAVRPAWTQLPTQPSAKATTTRPCASTATSMKSRRLRVLPQVVPAVQMVPRWTGSSGVASTVVQVAPPS